MPRCGSWLGKIGGESLGEGDRFFKRQKSRWKIGEQILRTSLQLWGAIPVVVLVYKEKSIEKCLDFEWIFLIGKVWDAGIPGFSSISGLLGDSMFSIYTTEN